MKLDMIGIITKDMEKSIEFYALLGFIANGATTEEYVELAHEGIRISLNTSKMIAGIYGYEPQTIGDKIELAFLCDSVADVDEMYRKVSDAGYETFKEPWDAFWGQRYAIIKDPDGNLLSLFANFPTK
ncbi:MULTISPECIES: VOC family protein [Enterococcus]|mgnify:CR=1 FL=1|uniref:Glyoxylase n=1 Tax=Enterococcus thailandicus TaxID=417368 RepID=A0A179ESV6_ENTTH|nr:MULTISPECIES: VOC family protein [Enterococcus]MDA3965157.1 VOC family protein [Enterococcus thailandicus]MDK4353231.1 VOC family protein [Enterococcus thailandicus]MDT2733153.1 VOC family protein [Enterococcus thailandicus]MDT2845645.1 VOC family protein [Enterococcus thailandicus]MEA4829119.1 VOC family protein [Enterococcus thailandicus]